MLLNTTALVTYLGASLPICTQDWLTCADKQILWLDIPVHNVVLMAPGDCFYKLIDVLPDLSTQLCGGIAVDSGM